MSLKSIVIIGVIIILLIIALQNMNTISVRILFWDISASQVFMIPLIFLAGLGTGVVLARLKWRKGKGGK